MGWHVLYGASVKQNEVEHLGALINVFLPLSLLSNAAGGLTQLSLVDGLGLLNLCLRVICFALGGKIFKQVDEPTIFYV
jgi:hypothetical protein